MDRSVETTPDPATGRGELVLDARLTAASAETLAEKLKGLRGNDLAVDASALSFIATPCLQVLLAAGRSWRSDGHALVLRPSDDFLASIGDIGIDLGSFQSEATE